MSDHHPDRAPEAWAETICWAQLPCLRAGADTAELRSLEPASHTGEPAKNSPCRARLAVQNDDLKAPNMANVVCILCGIVLKHPKASENKRKGSLQSLHDHLKNCTNNEARAPSDQPELLTRTDYLASGTAKLQLYMFSKQKLEDAQLAACIKCNIPFATFEIPSFKCYC